MSIIHWPPDTKRRDPLSAPKPTVDTLPNAILDHFAASLPGPKHETEAGRAARIAARREEILSYGPRNSAEAMIATHCVLLGMIARDARRDAARQPPGSSTANKIRRVTKQLSEHSTELQRIMAERPSPPPGETGRAPLGALARPGANDASQVEDAVSAVIVPLHPAPKMLQ